MADRGCIQPRRVGEVSKGWKNRKRHVRIESRGGENAHGRFLRAGDGAIRRASLGRERPRTCRRCVGAIAAFVEGVDLLELSGPQDHREWSRVRLPALPIAANFGGLAEVPATTRRAMWFLAQRSGRKSTRRFRGDRTNDFGCLAGRSRDSSRVVEATLGLRRSFRDLLLVCWLLHLLSHAHVSRVASGFHGREFVCVFSVFLGHIEAGDATRSRHFPCCWHASTQRNRRRYSVRRGDAFRFEKR